MSKRFTDTSKWKRPWFQALSKDAKLLWLFLCDDCDHAGIWIADFDLISLRLGMKIDEEILGNLVGSKIVKIDVDKYFIPSYLEFQYGSKDTKFRAKKSAYDKLHEFGLIDENGLIKDLANSYLTVSKDLAKTIGIGKGISIGKGESEGKNQNDLASPQDFETIYKRYPKKIGKSDGLAKLRKDCPTKTKLADFSRAIDNYVASCKANNTYFKQFDTFVNSNWEDWLDPEAGKTENKPSDSKRVNTHEDAQRVAAALKKYSDWLKNEKEVRSFLGDDLYGLAIKASTYDMRRLPANDFYIRSIAGMLSDARQQLSLIGE